MTKRSRRLIGMAVAALVAALLPVFSFGTDTLTVTLDKQAINVMEGQIHTNPDAAVVASAEYRGDVGGGWRYQWYECTSNGEMIQKVSDRYVEMNDSGSKLRIPEELAEGEYYYLCEIQLEELDSGEVAASSKSSPIMVTVAEGTPVVIFDPNGGAFAEILNNTQPLDVKIGADGKLPAGNVNLMPGREDYMFVGWYTEPSGGEQVDLSSKVFEHTTRLYAHYKFVKTATFDANGGIFEGGETEYHVNFTGDILAKDQFPPDPTKEGYVFAGWYTEGADGEEYMLTPISGTDGYEFYSDGMIVYAKWTKSGAEETNVSEGNGDGSRDGEQKLDDSPAAGDDSDMLLWMMAAGMAIVAGSALNRRKA